MKIAAVGEYRLADGRMNFDLLMTHGRGEVKAKVTGTAASPSIRALPTSILRTEPGRIPGRLKRLFEGLSKQDRRCLKEKSRSLSPRRISATEEFPCACTM